MNFTLKLLAWFLALSVCYILATGLRRASDDWHSQAQDMHAIREMLTPPPTPAQRVELRIGEPQAVIVETL